MIITQKVGDTNTTFRKLQYHWQQTTHAISLKSKIMNILEAKHIIVQLLRHEILWDRLGGFRFC